MAKLMALVFAAGMALLPVVLSQGAMDLGSVVLNGTDMTFAPSDANLDDLAALAIANVSITVPDLTANATRRLLNSNTCKMGLRHLENDIEEILSDLIDIKTGINLMELKWELIELTGKAILFLDCIIAEIEHKIDIGPCMIPLFELTCHVTPETCSAPSCLLPSFKCEISTKDWKPSAIIGGKPGMMGPMGGGPKPNMGSMMTMMMTNHPGWGTEYKCYYAKKEGGILDLFNHPTKGPYSHDDDSHDDTHPHSTKAPVKHSEDGHGSYSAEEKKDWSPEKMMKPICSATTLTPWLETPSKGSDLPRRALLAEDAHDTCDFDASAVLLHGDYEIFCKTVGLLPLSYHTSFTVDHLCLLGAHHV